MFEDVKEPKQITRRLNAAKKRKGEALSLLCGLCVLAWNRLVRPGKPVGGPEQIAIGFRCHM